jgi:hypothetical protein
MPRPVIYYLAILAAFAVAVIVSVFVSTLRRGAR